MNYKNIFTIVIVFIAILLFIYVLFSPLGVPEKALNDYCKKQEIFFKSEILDGIILDIHIDEQNHGVREIVILDSLRNTYQVSIIGVLDWEQVELLNIGDKVGKGSNSFELIFSSKNSVNILKYCDEYFHTN